MSGDQKQSRVIVGTWGLFDWSRRSSLDYAVELLNEACRLGYNRFDTAVVYGRGMAEVALSKIPKNTRIDTKIPTRVPGGVGVSSREAYPLPYFESYFQNSLDNLKRDRVDTLYLHNWSFSWRDFNHLEHLANIARDKSKSFGVSLGSDYDLKIKTEDLSPLIDVFDVFQIPYCVSIPNNRGTIGFLLSKEKRVVLRSVFGHGMLIKEDSELQEFNPSLRRYSPETRSQLRESVEGNTQDERRVYCLRDALSISGADVVIGVSKVRHLEPLV